MIREIKDTINVRVRNNTAFTQNVNLLGGTADPLGVPPSLLYQWDLSNETFSGTLTAKIIISNTSNPTPVTYTVQVTQLNVSGVAYALNTLNLGVFQVSGNIIYVSNDYYIYGALSVSGVTILGTTGIFPNGIVINTSGSIFTSNQGSNNVSKITQSGVSTILASVGVTPNGIVIDSFQNLYTPNRNTADVSKVTPLGVSTILGNTALQPSAIAIDSLGNIYTANQSGNNITKITPLGISTNYGSLSFNVVQQMVVDSVGNVYVVCSANTVIKVEPSGVSTPFGVYPLGTNTNSIAIDSSDNIYVANEQTVWKLTPSAVQTTYGTTIDFIQYISIDSLDNIYCTLQNGNIEKVLSNGGTTIIADLSGYGGFPFASIVDSNFNVYVTDVSNNVVYLIVQ
jgi:streptogramin lyase